MATEKINKKVLCDLYNISRYVLNERLKALLSDVEIKRKFGSYCGSFTPKQINIIYSEWGNPKNAEV